MKKTYNLAQIFRLNSQRTNVLVLAYVWFAAGFCFYGLIMNLEHLGGDIFTDSLVTFSGEIFSEILSGWCADEFGRVLVLKGSGFLGGISFILYEVISDPTMKSILIFGTSMGFSATFNVIYIYSPEIFPTTIRSTVMGFLYLISRFGALAAPSLSAMVPHNPVLFGIAAIISSYLCFQLEETLGKDIADDVPEAKRQMSFLSRSPLASQRKLSYVSKVSINNRTVVSDLYFKIDEF